MSAVDKAFAAFDASLNLDPAERLKAQARHNEIRAVLDGAGVISGSFLQGSFARKTMLKPLKDVDIVCLLAEHLRSQLLAPGGPQKAMNLFEDAVSARWADAGFDEGEDPPAGKALRVSFPDCTFTVDLVPAFPTDSEIVLIGDRDKDEWSPSTTRILNRLIATRNQATDGRFVHQARMTKSLKHTHDDLEDVDGIAFESICYEIITTTQPHQTAMAAALAHASAAARGPIYDPAHENDLTEKWTGEQRGRILRAFSALAGRAAQAIALEEAGDEDSAVDVWHSVFGEEFPAPPHRDPEEVMSA